MVMSCACLWAKEFPLLVEIIFNIFGYDAVSDQDSNLSSHRMLYVLSHGHGLTWVSDTYNFILIF